ncbi:hypothetical protein QQS21_008853 [Conoideocrella luteorostrata]|uniref:Uncharacterized protein n=1 Tax=Conoideocrella luteorostrata TaxID=1105319 RepID=A0AAJ0CMG7_9HYPO|nr:hypothetical protein QQS21_008853 [Conoideocrella luteorostrata]
MSPRPEANQATQRDGGRSPSPEETPDIVPSRLLSAEEAEQDYQKQLALLAEQEAAYRAQTASGSNNPEETPDIMPSKTLSREEAEADYQKQLALLEQRNRERFERQKTLDEENKARL